MAKISAEFDTKEKTLAVRIDGKSVDNVVGVELSKSYYTDDEDEYSCSVMTMQKDEANDLRTYTRLMAAESEGAAGRKSNAFAGFLEHAVEALSKGQVAIQRFFAKD